MSPIDRLTRDNLDGLVNPEEYQEALRDIEQSERLAGDDLEKERVKWQMCSDFRI